jgi:hypothetical protein
LVQLSLIDNRLWSEALIAYAPQPKRQVGRHDDRPTIDAG